MLLISALIHIYYLHKMYLQPQVLGVKCVLMRLEEKNLKNVLNLKCGCLNVRKKHLGKSLETPVKFTFFFFLLWLF